MASKAPLLKSRKATVVKAGSVDLKWSFLEAAWQLENAIEGKFLETYPEEKPSIGTAYLL